MLALIHARHHLAAPVRPASTPPLQALLCVRSALAALCPKLVLKVVVLATRASTLLVRVLLSVLIVSRESIVVAVLPSARSARLVSTRIKLVKPPANCVIRVLTRASWVLSRVASVQRALSVLKRARTSVQPARKAPMLRLPVHRSAPNARLVNSRPPLGKLLANCAPLVLTRTLLGNQSVLYAPRGPSPSTLEIHNALTAHQAQPMMW